MNCLNSQQCLAKTIIDQTILRWFNTTCFPPFLNYIPVNRGWRTRHRTFFATYRIQGLYRSSDYLLKFLSCFVAERFFFVHCICGPWFSCQSASMQRVWQCSQSFLCNRSAVVDGQEERTLLHYSYTYSFPVELQLSNHKLNSPAKLHDYRRCIDL